MTLWSLFFNSNLVLQINWIFLLWDVLTGQHVYFCSHFLYPDKSWKIGDNGEDEASSCGDGKYELLSVANKHMVEEIKNVMSKSKSF